jgi:predicted amidohydrolase
MSCASHETNMETIKPLKIAMVQDVPGVGLRDNFGQILHEFKPDILAFSEYFLVGSEQTNTTDSSQRSNDNIGLIKQWSLEFNCLVVGGTIVEVDNNRNFNRCYLIDRGNIIGFYDKIHLYRNEGHGQITPGSEYRVIQWGDLKIGLLICADVLYPESFQALAKMKPDLVFIPTTSPYKPGEQLEVKFARDNDIYARGAALADAILFKVNATGSIVGHRLQGRSLIASPNKIHWRIDPIDEDKAALILVSLNGDRRNPSLDIVAHLG